MREVLARVEVFEEAGCRFQVVVFEVDGVFLKRGAGVFSEGWKVRRGVDGVGGKSAQEKGNLAQLRRRRMVI